MVWKQVNNADTGTADLVGGNDWDKLMQALSAIDVDDIDMNCDFTFRSGKANFRNPANTFSYNIVAAAIAATRQLNLPLTTATDTLATLGLAQTFTEMQTMSKNQTDLLTLYRTSNTVGNTIGFNLDAQNSTPAQFTYGRIRVEIVDNTAGNEDSKLLFYRAIAGTSAAALEVSNDGGLAFGANVRAKMNDTGLSTFRNYTLPDADSLLFGNGVDNSLGAHYLDIGEIPDPSSPAANTGRVFFDDTDEHIKIKKSGGAVVDLESTSGSAGSTGDVQYNDGSSGFAAEAAFNYVAASNQLTVPGLTIAEDMLITGVISPSSFSTTQNDYNPTNLATNSTLRLTATAKSFITGITAQSSGTELTLLNVGTEPILLKNANAGSSAANRFLLPQDIELFPNMSCIVRYDGTDSRWRLKSLVSPLADHQIFDVSDELHATSVSNTLTSNQFGTLSWGIVAANGTSAPTTVAGVANHPGIIRLTTGATSGNDCIMMLSNASATAAVDPIEIERLVYIVRVPTITNVNVKAGAGQSLGAASYGTAAVYIVFDPAVDSHWQTITRQASTSTTNTTGVTVNANDWYLLEMRRQNDGDWEFWINESLVFTHSTNLPTTALNIGARVGTATTAARDLDVDFFRLRMTDLGQRWT